MYVMTDFTQSNVDAWLAHPQLQDAFAAGVLDVALCVVKWCSPVPLVKRAGWHDCCAFTCAQIQWRR